MNNYDGHHIVDNLEENTLDSIEPLKLRLQKKNALRVSCAHRRTMETYFPHG